MKEILVVLTLTTLVLFGAACGKDDERPPENPSVSEVIERPSESPSVIGVIEGRAKSGESAPDDMPEETQVKESQEPIAKDSQEDERRLAPDSSWVLPESGLVPLQEHILASDVVARVRLRSMEATGRWAEERRETRISVPYIIITFDVWRH